MSLLKQLTRWKNLEQIDQPIIDLVLILKHRLQQRWLVNTDTPLVEILLMHIASSLGRLQRGGCVSPLYQEFYDEMKNADIFPYVLSIHHDLLALLPHKIPEAEQSYYLANIYSLLLEQGITMTLPKFDFDQ